MTQRILSAIMLIVIVSLISYKAFSSSNTVKASSEITLTDGLTKEPLRDHSGTKQVPYFPLRESKQTHGKMHTPHMDEEAHIHKFHKERVKKIKKHTSKFWILSKLILILCHISILVIAFLHATH